MRKHLFGIALLALVQAAMGFAAEDPFTGTWRDRMVDSPLLVLAPVSGGISIQDGTQKPEIVPYGKDTLRVNRYTTNTVRIDNQTLKSTISRNGSSFYETATASPDGKHFTRVQEFGENLKLITDYERVGPVPSGDAFFGTWKRAISENSPSRTVKVDGDNFEWSDLVPDGGPLGAPGLTGKFDGKGYQGRGILSGITFVLKRIDARTIEITSKVPPMEIPQALAEILSPEEAASVAKGSESKEIWRVKGDILTITIRNPDGAQSSPRIQEFERIK